MEEAGAFFIIPFLRAVPEAAGAVLVGAHDAPTEVIITVRKPNGQVIKEVKVMAKGPATAPAVAIADLFALADCGVLHVEADEWVAVHLETSIAGDRHRSQHAANVRDGGGTVFQIDETDARHPFAMLGNGGDTELFVFVNDMQGPFIPPFGAARIQIPKPGERLHVTVDNGEGILTYRGAFIAPSV